MWLFARSLVLEHDQRKLNSTVQGVSFDTFVRARAEATGVGIWRNDTPLSKQAGLLAANSLGAHISRNPHTFQAMYNSHAYRREEFCIQDPRL
jgi:hypothetical protein